MTAAVDRAGGELGFPLLGRLLVAISAVATLLAAVAAWRFWPDYAFGPAMVAMWCLSAATVPVAVVRILRARAMTATTLGGLAAVVLGVDLVVPLMLDPGLRAGPAAWNWRTGAVLIVVLSAYRPARDVALLATAHAGVAIAWTAGAGAVTLTAGVVLALVCAAPSLAAANYLAVYTEGLRVRRVAVDRQLQVSALRAADTAARQSVLDEVTVIRRQMIALLDAVGAGERDPAQPDVQREARDLSAALRRELDETRSRGWLVPAASDGPPVDVLGPATSLDDEARMSVAALIALLRRHEHLTRLVVTIGDGAEMRGRIDVTIVASGPGSAVAASDPAVLAAAADLGTTVWHDAEAGHLVVETHVRAPIQADISSPREDDQVTD